MSPFSTSGDNTEVGVIENQITFTPKLECNQYIYGIDDILYDGDIKTNLFLSVDTLL